RAPRRRRSPGADPATSASRPPARSKGPSSVPPGSRPPWRCRSHDPVRAWAFLPKRLLSPFIRAFGRCWPMWLRWSRGSHASPIEFVLKDRDRMVRVQRQRTESDDERATLGQDAFLGLHEILVVREHKGGVRGETRFPNVFAACLGVDESGREAIKL